MQSLSAFVESLNSQQKLFLLLESNLRVKRTLEDLNELHKEALDDLKTKTGVVLISSNTTEFIESATPLGSSFSLDQEIVKNSILIVPFELLYKKAQEIAEIGTPLQKKLFALHATPEDFAHTKESK
jgi:hypothetical protein